MPVRTVRYATHVRSLHEGNTMPIRVGVIGAGIMGADHIRNLSTTIGGAEVTFVADLDADRAAAAAPPSARITTDPSELINSSEVDAVVVASHDSTHAGLVLECFEAMTPVLCEKPLAPTLSGKPRSGGGGRRHRGRDGSFPAFAGLHAALRPGLRGTAAGRAGRAQGEPLMVHCISRNGVRGSRRHRRIGHHQFGHPRAGHHSLAAGLAHHGSVMAGRTELPAGRRRAAGSRFYDAPHRGRHPHHAGAVPECAVRLHHPLRGCVGTGHHRPPGFGHAADPAGAEAVRSRSRRTGGPGLPTPTGCSSRRGFPRSPTERSLAGRRAGRTQRRRSLPKP